MASFLVPLSWKKFLMMILPQAEFRSNMEELLSVLSHQDLSWLRKRVVTLWPSWVEAINELVKDKQIINRNKKKVKINFHVHVRAAENSIILKEKYYILILCSV